MQRNLVRNLLFIGIALLLLGTSLTVVRIVMVHADANQRFTLSNQTVPLLSHAQLLQAADANQQLNLSIGLQLRDAAALGALLSALNDPQSPQYHHYLTPDQFTQLFAPTAEQVQQVITYLQGQGLTITDVAPNNLLIDATGSVAQVQHSFHMQINHYQLRKHTFYANANPPSVPAAISQLIASIGGLDNAVQYQPLYQRFATQHSDTYARAHEAAGPTGLAPKDLAGAYDLAPLQSNGMLGDNQSIALFELDGYQLSDIAPFFQNYGINMPNITNIPVNGFNGAIGQGAIEDELDIEVVGAMAPHANIFVYEGPNTTQGINDTYNKIVNDNKVQVTSISWGLCEISTGNAELQTLDTIFKQGVAEGITFVAASGDSGAYDCQDTNLGVDSPASDPYVTGVGATSLQLNSDGLYSSESVWSNSSQTQRGPKGAGSGGGISNTFGHPNWQSGPGVNQYGSGNRKVPDVTAAGDPTNGYSIYCTVTNAGCPPTGWMQVGGTSAAAPLWASCLVLVNQYLQAHNKTVLGHANPALYALLNTSEQYPPFHDITTGMNLFYQATPGYDVASGLGSPDVYNIARDLLSPVAGGTPTPGPTSTPTPTPTPIPSPLPPPSLIKNGGFENGQTPWQESSSQGYQMIDTSNAHTGQYSVYFCGYMGCDDSISQGFNLPTSFTKITITYWWYSDTNKTTKQCLDKFDSRLQDSSGSAIINLQHSCNFDAINGWQSKTFDVSAKQLSAYKGKTVTLSFHGTNAQNQYQTSDFFVDDVTITVS
jgi:subtilase family serine protease